MQTEQLMQLVHKIQHYKCEFQTIEVKTAIGGCPKLYDSLSSFSNQEMGGIIVLGLREKDKQTKISDFAAVGVYNVQDIQQKVASQCKEMEPEVRPLFTVAEIDGKFIVAVEVPAVDVSERPVFYKGAGRQKGSYVRVGDADEQMNEYEIYTYDAFRRRTRDDLRIIEGAKTSLLQGDRLQNYLDAVKAESENLSNNSSDEEILELLGVTSNGIPTLSGVMAFGKYPQAYFPQLSITAVVVPGTQMGDTGPDDVRFLANKRFNGTVTEMLNGAVDFVKRNMRMQTVIDEDGTRKDKPEFPIKAVREVILNALVHRDYSIHTEGSPITICMYSDRMEVTNKGGLYGRITIDLLGKVHPEARNPALANILEVMHETENRYSGIPTIRREMEKAGLPAPEFEDRRGEFKVILRNNLGQRSSSTPEGVPTLTVPSELSAREQALLEFCITPRTREEIVSFTGFTRYYTMSHLIKPLVERGYLKRSIPEKPKSPNQKFYFEP